MATANLGFEENLWQMADKLRGSMDSSEYKNVVLGLLFLKYVSDAFEEKYEAIKADEWADEEDRDEYLADNIFFVPKEARWSFINDHAKTPEIGQLIDAAMIAIEKENPSLVGVLPKSFARPELDKTRLGETIDLFSFKVGDEESRSKDILGRVYEYFLSKFASAEGKNGGEFYTPSTVVQLLVEMIEPFKGRVYDPACGSGGMFVQSSKFVKEHQGRIDNLSVYGQESNPTTWKLAKMNLAIRGIDANLGAYHADTFHNDLHKGLKADYIIANPPFNISDWGGEKLIDDVRWQYGIPPKGNANYAWVQHIVSKLAPAGTAGFVLANGSMSSNTGGEGDIRKNLIENDLVECIVTLPGQLFYSTQIPVCLWFVSKDKVKTGKRERNKKILFIDARNLGFMSTRTLKEFSEDDIKKVADTFHSWRGTNEQEYADEIGFCKEAKLEEVRNNDYILTPGRFVGLAEQEDNGEPLEDKMTRLTGELSEQFGKSKELEEHIRRALGGLGMEFENYKLSEVMEIVGGGTPKRSVKDYWNGEINWLSVKDFNNNKRKVHRTEEKITLLGLTKSSTKLLDKGDIILSARGTVGAIAQLAKPMAFNQSCYGIKANNLTSNDYLYYWLKYNVDYLKNNTHGTVFDTITRDTFDKLDIKLPSKENQHKIVEILSSFDEKIDNNEQIVINLEKLSQTLFQHWFIDFKYPNEEGKPYKSNGGEMVESDLGEVPKGWIIEKLSNICEVKDGTHDSPKQVENGYPLVTSKHLTNYEIDFSTTKLISEEDFIKVNKRSLVETQDILISMIGTVGRLYFVQEENINYAIKNIGLIKSSQIDIAEFIYMYFKSPFMINHIKERMTGSTQQYISLTELRKIPVILPNEDILNRYSKLVKPNFDMIFSLIQENQKLSQLRDTLLPKLISGEIELPDDLEVE